MTKVPGGLNNSELQAAHNENLQLLGLGYVDHLMLHYPADWAATPARSNPARRQEGWKALEAIYKRGEARSIGVSHYCSRHIQDILDVATVKPSINQVEYHVGAGDVDEVIEFCRKHGITFQSYSPLCGPCDADPKDSLISGDLVSGIAKKHGVSGSQVSLRWIVQQALTTGSFIGPVIPKSSNPAHIASNIDLFGFKLDNEDMQLLRDAAEPAGTPGDCEVP